MNKIPRVISKVIRNPSKVLTYLREKERNYRWERAKSKDNIVKNVFGDQMYLNKHDEGVSKPLFLDGIFSPAETQFYASFIQENMVIADIGANIGYFTLQFSNGASEGKIYSFEPDPRNYKFLEKNIKENQKENVILEQKAISSSVGEIELYRHPINGGGHSIHKDSVLPFDEFPETGDSVSVDATTFDEYFCDKPTPDLVKIDVEGGEPDVLNGMTDSLHDTPVLLFEFTPHMWSTPVEDVFNLLESYGYKFYEISSEGRYIQKTKEELITYNSGWYDIICTTDSGKIP